MVTSGNPQHSHNPDDGWIDGNGSRFHLFQEDANTGQDDYDHIQLVPPLQGETKHGQGLSQIGWFKTCTGFCHRCGDKQPFFNNHSHFDIKIFLASIHSSGHENIPVTKLQCSSHNMNVCVSIQWFYMCMHSTNVTLFVKKKKMSHHG